ncbi:MAG: arylamine N-acetyltransferase, partial [Thiothrix sp.]|nr:arylamine N-acetyltransferase [Thiothrix sp.]
RAANRPKTHAALLVGADGQDWLVDLGFGSFGVREPLRLDGLDVAVPQDDETFRLTCDPDGEYVLSALLEGTWQAQYSFDLSPQRWVDFATGNYFNAMHPESIFRQQPMLLRFTPQGRNILFAGQLTQVVQGQSHRRELADGELVQVLPTLFGLNPDTLPARVLFPSPRRPADTLGMTVPEMRRLGYQVVDRVVEHQMYRDREPAIRTGQSEMLQDLLGGEVPEQPMDAAHSLMLLADVALAHQQHGDHPRYFARVPGPSSFAAVLGEWLGTGFNTIATSWGGGSGPATVETIVTGWLAQLLGMPPQTEGVLQSGGSLASLTAFLVARRETGAGSLGVAYLTDQSHASLVRNLRQMGLPERQIRVLPSDTAYRMDTERLVAALQEDREAGLVPMLVVASAGTTNTGAVDPLPALAALCRREGLWFHVDGAYGAPAALTEAGRAYLSGLALADSLVLDPHKWLFQPYDAGVCLVSRAGALERCFAMYPEYLHDARGQDPSVTHFGNRSLELSRRSRALKLWFSLRTYGVARLRSAIQQG